jgi:hypothetical protein
VRDEGYGTSCEKGDYKLRSTLLVDTSFLGE